MASFAKACVDLSNNLRNFRFNKSPQAIAPLTNSSGISANNNHHSNNIDPRDAKSNESNFLDVHHNHSRSTTPPSSVGGNANDSARGSPTISRGATVAAIKQRLFNQGLKIDLSPKRKKKTRYRDYMTNLLKTKTKSIDQFWQTDSFLKYFFRYFSPNELCQLALICRKWNTILHEYEFWKNQRLVFNFKGLQSNNMADECRHRSQTLVIRHIDSITLNNMSDRHINDFITEISSCERQITQLQFRCTSLTDRSVERIIETLTNLSFLEFHCCNDITEVCLWSCLVPSITNLSISDCINISDESVGAISQLLPHLKELNLQAYHVTDTAMTYFSTKQRVTLETLRITQCMDITNQGVVNLAHALPALKILSLSGCSKLADDGVDVVCEKMKQLTSLDLSWCPKITDSGLECVACDLTQLEYLSLDRCSGITDTGISYLATMPSLVTLNLRWCSGVTDAGLIHILNMVNLRNLSLAGCKRISEDGLCVLVQHGRLHQLEITSCRAATLQVKSYLKQNLPNCLIIS